MPTISDYLFQVSSSGVVGVAVVGTFVRLTDNVLLTTFVSSSPTNSAGQFTVTNVPAGTYTLATGPTAGGPWTNQDPNYFVGADIHGSNIFTASQLLQGPGPWFDVKSYGAKGDGSTDDTTSIQSALNACRTAGGGTVFFPPGTYMVSVAVRVGGQSWATGIMYGPNTQIRGVSSGVSIIRLVNNASGTVGTGSNTAAVITPWATSQERVTFEELTLDGNAGNQTDQINGIYVLQQRGVKFHRVRVMNCRGINNSGGNTETGCYVVSGATDVSFVDCEAIQTAGTCSNGFGVSGSNSVLYTGCRAINIGTATSFGFGFNVGTTGAGSRQIVYEACHAYLCGTQGYHIDSANCQNLVYKGCVSGGVASDIASGQQYPFTSGQNLGNQFGWLMAVAASDVLWDHCICYGNSSTGFEIRAGSGLQLVGCVANNNGGAGLNFNTGAPVANVVGGDFSNNTAFGIGMQNSIVTVRVTGGPTMTGNGTGPLNIGGTNYTPGGNVAAPGVPATTTPLTNPFGYDADVYVLPGASTCAVSVAGVATGVTLASSGVAQLFRVPAKESITLTYTSAPTWKWFI